MPKSHTEIAAIHAEWAKLLPPFPVGSVVRCAGFTGTPSFTATVLHSTETDTTILMANGDQMTVSNTHIRHDPSMLLDYRR